MHTSKRQKTNGGRYCVEPVNNGTPPARFSGFSGFGQSMSGDFHPGTNPRAGRLKTKAAAKKTASRASKSAMASGTAGPAHYAKGTPDEQLKVFKAREEREAQERAEREKVLAEKRILAGKAARGEPKRQQLESLTHERVRLKKRMDAANAAIKEKSDRKNLLGRERNLLQQTLASAEAAIDGLAQAVNELIPERDRMLQAIDHVEHKLRQQTQRKYEENERVLALAGDPSQRSLYLQVYRHLTELITSVDKLTKDRNDLIDKYNHVMTQLKAKQSQMHAKSVLMLETQDKLDTRTEDVIASELAVLEADRAELKEHLGTLGQHLQSIDAMLENPSWLDPL